MIDINKSLISKTMPPENTNQTEKINQISSEIANDLSFLLIRQKRARRRKLVSSVIIVLLVIIVGCFSMIYQNRRPAVQKEYSLTKSGVFSEMGFVSFKIVYPLSWNYLEGAWIDENVIYFSPNPIYSNMGYGEIMMYPKSGEAEPWFKDSNSDHSFINDKGKVVATIYLNDEKYRKEYEQMISSFKLIN